MPHVDSLTKGKRIPISLHIGSGQVKFDILKILSCHKQTKSQKDPKQVLQITNVLKLEHQILKLSINTYFPLLLVLALVLL